MRNTIFTYLKTLSEFIVETEAKRDKEFIENSLLILDEKLRDHWPMKGRLEVEVFQVRSAEITGHKRRYERHIRQVIDDADIQTESFNLLLERSIEAQKMFETEQKQCCEELPEANSLSQLQGIKNREEEGYFKFKEQTLDFEGQMDELCGRLILALKKANENYLIQSTLFDNGGLYSKHEVQWYKDMMVEINQQLDDQIQQRTGKKGVMIDRLNSVREKQYKKFCELYEQSVDELAAKQGTGRKFGRPKRIAQEKLRKEMTKCENAQENIDTNLKMLKDQYNDFYLQKDNPKFFLEETEELSLKIRKILMTLRTCTQLYGNHIQAFKEENQMTEMPRVSYDQLTFDINVPEDEEAEEEDKQRLEEEKESLGMLYYQKEEMNSMEFVDQIEDLVKSECQKLYTGEKAKLLTGQDNIPDYLREYFVRLKENAETYRIQSARLLRNSCEVLGEISKQINDMVISYIEHLYKFKTEKDIRDIETNFDGIHKDTYLLKERYMFELRPNLCNPACKDEFEALKEKEGKRLKGHYDFIKKTKSDVIEFEEKHAQNYLKIVLNNYYFLMTYYQNSILKEDFIKLPGDENLVKKHYHLKKLIKLKEDGFVIDTSSERAIKKKRTGVPLDTFSLPENEGKFVETVDDGVEDKGKGKGKKAPPKKKDKGKGGTDDVEESREGFSREMETFKTIRQNSLYSIFMKSFKLYKQRYYSHIEKYRTLYEKVYEQEMKFEFRWDQTIERIFKF